MNMDPDRDVPAYTSPKIDLSLEMQTLSVGVTRAQYQRLLQLADGLGALILALPYRQFRPFQTRKQWR